MQIATTNSFIYKNLKEKYAIKHFPTLETLLEDPINYDLYIIKYSPKVAQLKRKGKFIFYDTDMDTLFAVEPMALLSSPIQFSLLEKIITNIEIKINNATIFIMQFDKCTQLNISEINYVNIENRCLTYHMIKGNESTTTIQTSFKKATPLINHSSFIFLEPALLVNIYNIKSVGNDFITFNNNEKLYIPKTKHSLIISKLKDIND